MDHTIGAANTIDRILDVFPPQQRYQISVQLSMMLEAVVSQQLVPTVDGKLTLAYEIMTTTPAVRTLIRENKIHQLNNVIYSSQENNMLAMDTCLLQMYKSGIISKETALTYATSSESLSKKL